MNTLAFDTCFGACSVAATWSLPQGAGSLPQGAGSLPQGAVSSPQGGGSLPQGGAQGIAGAYRFELLERGHAERLTPMIGEAMADAAFDFAGIARIVVTTGPGTFTGQRVGIAAARALSLATGAPVGTLSSLAVMAYAAAAGMPADLDGKLLAVAVDARRGEIYFQCFQYFGQNSGPTCAALGEPELTSPEEAARTLGDMETIAVGSGAEMLSAAARGLGVRVTARLGALQPDVRFIPDGAVTPGSDLPRPLYLRPPDAKPQARAALERTP